MPEPFRFNSGPLAHSPKDLIGVCHQSPEEVIYHLKRGDFENWLAYIGETEIAQKVGKVRQSSVSDEDKLQQFLTILQPPEPEIVIPTSEEKETISSSTPSSQSNPTPEAQETTSTTDPQETTSPTPEAQETTSVTPEPQETTPATTEPQETTPATTEPQETSPITDAQETTPVTTEPQETSPITDAQETTPKVTTTEDKSSTKTPASLVQETENKEVKPITPPNEYSDEMPTPNSLFAKALKDFIDRYISSK